MGGRLSNAPNAPARPRQGNGRSRWCASSRRASPRKATRSSTSTWATEPGDSVEFFRLRRRKYMIGPMANTKRAQNGSAGGIIFLAVVAGLIWWQWDRIENFFGVAAKGAAAEVKGFTCTAQSSGKTLIEGKVVNLTDAPLALRAITAIY